MSQEDTNVRVAVRCRPMNSRETAMATTKCINIKSKELTITGPGGDDHSFGFDIILGEDSLQSQMWDHIGTPILEKAFSGYNGTIFAYGQTGSGKTWSMQGLVQSDNDELEGVIPRMNRALFERIEKQKALSPTLHFLITCSYFELYNEVIFDLLDVNDRKNKRMGLEIKEHPVLGVYVKGLKEIVVDCPEKIQGIVDQGMKSRTVATTQMNADSSRSHSVFTVKIHQKDSEDESKNLFAKINLVDLAGSERVKSTGASGATLKEGANINKSLSALGNVINALVEQAKNPKKCPFIPYRNSKLTRVLQESLGGNSITVMIAALSPALCNFEETLSTLKYANRAKAIKVRAVKNDESSQIGRLNNEIQALKDKLLLQASSVDTSLLEEKHQQQLRDLEEAMKSTWEEKARISEAHENDRKRLLKEQAEAEKKLNLHQEKNWKLLEEKGDLGLSIGRVNEMFNNVAQTVIEPKEVAAWGSDLRNILRLEDKLLQQATVVEVYNAALHRDGERFLNSKEHNREKLISTGDQFSLEMGLHEDNGKSFDEFSVGNNSVSVAQWKQLREKFHGLQNELKKWLTIRDELGLSIDNIIASFNRLFESWSGDDQLKEQRADNPDICRGLKLLQAQSNVKKCTFDSSSDRVLVIAKSFKSMANALLGILDENEHLLGEDEDAKVAAFTVTSESRVKIRHEMKKCMVELKENFGSSGFISTMLTNNSFCGRPVLELCDYNVRYKGCDVKNPLVNSPNPWVFTRDENNDDDSPYLEVIFSKKVELSSLTIQGGQVSRGSPLEKNEHDQTQAMFNSDINQPSAASNFSVLPCGLGISDCDGSIKNTVSLLADVISWHKITKKNSPETFLKRPPVRFLFDVINAVDAVAGTSVFSTDGQEDAKKTHKDWSVVGATKESKLSFMESVLTYVSKAILLPPSTTANAIVTGANAELTNIFLQHLSIVAYQSMKEHSQFNTHLPPPGPHTISSGVQQKQDDDVYDDCTGFWLDEFKLSWSYDGVNYTNVTEAIITNLQDATMSKQISALDLSLTDTYVKSLRIYPLKWKNKSSCLRWSFHAFVGDKDVNHAAFDSRKCIEALVLLRNTTEILGVAADYISKIKELAATQRQEAAMKKMESIVDEKIAQEQALLIEKLALNSEKSSLEEQLKAAMEQLREMEKALVREKSYREQLDSVRNALEEEKKALLLCVKEQGETISETQTQLLKLQATAKRDNKLVETLRKNNEDNLKEIGSLNSELKSLKDEKMSWFTDREDLMNQVEVLTEERDDARRNEEELFDTLGERTNDLEKLQESYVNMTDRCNDYQDDICDLQENISSLQTLVNQPILPKGHKIAISEQVIATSQSSPILTGEEMPGNKTTSGPMNVVAVNEESTNDFLVDKDNTKNKDDEFEDNDNYDDEFEDNDNYDEEFED